MVIKISDEQYDELREKVVRHLLNPHQPGGAWFGGDQKAFDEWAGDVFDDTLFAVLEELNFELDF